MNRSFYPDFSQFIHERVRNRDISRQNKTKQLDILLAFWRQLSLVKQLTFLACSKLDKGLSWSRKGLGKVSITKIASDVLLVEEKGIWKEKEGKEFCFTNLSRWTLGRVSGRISLEHLRYGAKNPVFLFHLAPRSFYSLCPIKPYLCGRDCYHAQVSFNHQQIQFNWQVTGPKKKEEITYCYF